MSPFARESGSGPTLLCLHSNASSSSQWRALMEMLAPQFRVVAPDLLGAGRSPPWPDRPDVRLADEVAALAPLLAAAGDRFHVVGHSYGAAVAAKIALTMPGRLASLTLYEPTLFGLLEQAALGGEAAAGIAGAAAAASAAVERGDLHAAAGVFLDYWMGAGTWAAMPQARRDAVAESMRPIRGWAEAAFREPTTLSAFGALQLPVLLMSGENSPASAHGVVRLLAGALPQVQRIELPGIGHMGPVTHPAIVNEHIARFVREAAGRGLSAP